MTTNTLNYQNIPLPLSAAPQYWLAASTSGQTIVGNSADDAIYGVGGDTLVGGTGDDTFYVTSTDQVIVAPGGGVDTIVTYWGGYTLPGNVQNLIVQGDGAYGVGNSLDNVIEAVGPGEITLDGGGGNNVLTGGTGETIFVHSVAESNDVITNFQPGLDKVRLENTDLFTFAAVQSQMQQVGSDAVLNLGTDDSITFRNVQVSRFSPQDFMLPLDYSKLHSSFDEEFNSLSLWNGKSGTWSTTYPWAQPNGATLNNGELEWYINSNYAPTSSVQPWKVNNGILDITAAPASPSIQPLINNYQFTSGMLTTYDSFVQTYGVYEISAKVPAGQGLWEDFWLCPENGSWPPELDVMELNGANPRSLNTGVHSDSTGQQTVVGTNTPIPDASAAFHTYTVDWEPTTITWYFDGNEVFQTATPADMNQPMYMLVNLAVGGPYGNPINGTQFPANLQVDYIRAYATTAAPPVISQVSPAATADQLTLTGTAEGDSTVNIYEDRVLIGTAAASGTGAWSFTVGVPANGSHGFTATDSNAAHNTSTSSSALTVTVSVIQTDGSTSLIEVANQYFYLRASGGSSPALKYNGAAVTMGEFGSWTPIGAVQTASGYDVAWKNAGTGQYTVWTTETNGNYVGNLTGGAVSGTSYALESIESSFHQDLNGDGVIGPTATVIQTDGSTSLAEVGHLHFYLDGSSGIGPALRYNGTNFTVGEFGSWTPIGAVQTASGYDLAWKNTGSSQYTVWTTDSNGNYTGNLIGAVSATSTSLELLEPVFNQDLNGDGAIGLFAAPGTTLQISNALSGTSGSATIGTGATLELAAADSASITFASSTGSLRLDHSSTFTGEIFNFTGNGSLSGSDQLDLRDVHYSSVQDRYANGVLTVSDGSGDTAKLSFNGSYILANFKFASDGGGGTIVYDPPAPPINQNNNQAAGASSLAESFFGSNIALFANYIASAFVTAGHAGVTVTEALKSDQSLLCNPKHP